MENFLIIVFLMVNLTSFFGFTFSTGKVSHVFSGYSSQIIKSAVNANEKEHYVNGILDIPSNEDQITYLYEHPDEITSDIYSPLPPYFDVDRFISLTSFYFETNLGKGRLNLSYDFHIGDEAFRDEYRDYDERSRMVTVKAKGNLFYGNSFNKTRTFLIQEGVI